VLRTVASFRDPWEAHFLRLRLEAEGVPAVVVHEHHIWMYWTYSVALGGAKVQVPLSGLAQAEAVQQRCRAGDYRVELAAALGDLDDPRCPVCGSHRFTSRSAIPMLVLAAAAALWFGVAMPARASIRRCKDCGTGWRDGVRGVRVLGTATAARQPG
jgi:hypothetical protein